MLCGSSSHLLAKIFNQRFPDGLVREGGGGCAFSITAAGVTGGG